MTTLTQSEARILAYLIGANNLFKSPRKIHLKLSITYSYVCLLLNNFLEKGWVKKVKKGNKTFYELTSHAPLEEVKNIMLSLGDSLEDEQTRLIENG